MLYLLVLLAVATLVYIGWRMVRGGADRPSPRVIGPDDDPDFLWGLGQDEPRDHPRS